MNKKIILAILWLLHMSCIPAFAEDNPIIKVLPVPACAEAWNIEGKPDTYTRDNLFDRIDGEAEMYFPYGFEVLVSGRYVSKREPQIAVEVDVYKMGSLTDAFGIYASYRRVDDTEAMVGAEGIVSPAQLLFYQDRYFIRLQASGTLSIDRKVLLECAKSISIHLPAGKGRPTELRAFMIAGVKQKSERYIAQSVLGYPFFKRGFMADAVTPKAQMQVFILAEDSADAAQMTLRKYGGYLAQSEAKFQMISSDDCAWIESADPLYNNVFAEQCGRYVVGATKVKEASEAKQLIKQIMGKLQQP